MKRGDRVELRPILKRDGMNARVMFRAVAHGEVLKGKPGAIDIEWHYGMTPPSDEVLERQADSLGERLDRIEDQLEARRRRTERET